MRVYIPHLNDLTYLPPTVSLVNYLAEAGVSVVVHSDYSYPGAFHKKVTLINISSTADYPTGVLTRKLTRLKVSTQVVQYLRKNRDAIDFILLASWYFPFVPALARRLNPKIKILHQVHELELRSVHKLRAIDYVIVPEDNRAWITKILGDLRRKPIVVPNIPNVVAEDINFTPDDVVTRLKADGKVVLLYHGYAHPTRRCLTELVESLVYVDPVVHLVIMPSALSKPAVLRSLLEGAAELQLQDRVHLIPTRPSPEHLEVVKQADIGIGLYRATSLNQVYAAPNRLYEFCLFDTPVILPNYPSFASLSREYPYAVTVVDEESVESIAAGIQVLLDPENYAAGVRNSAAFREREGQYAHAASKVLAVLKNP